MHSPSHLEKRRGCAIDHHGRQSSDKWPSQRPWRVCLAVLTSAAVLSLLTRQLVVFFPSAASAPSWLAPARVGKDGAGSSRHDLSSTSGSLLAAANILSAKRQQPSPSSSAPSPAPTVLECFQVAQPVLGPSGGPSCSAASEESCTVLLMEHSFGLSYDKPFIGNYTPPSCQFNRVVMNFTVVSQGRQFDRLALMYFGDTEVWRTSTAEPTPPPGIRWVYQKDMTQYLSLWKSPQKLIFDLGNLIDDTYTGPFNTTLTATFFTSDAETGAAPPSDLIIPISKRQGAADKASHFTVPLDDASNTVGFPRNARRAVFSVSACGQADEEFWWSNVLQSDVFTFNATAGQLPGLSPFREVQVLIDGRVAGVQWPFPVIFTGGVVPSLHRPVVGLDAFDLREHEIDITPFLGLLCDGKDHTFAIRVAGLGDNGEPPANASEAINSNWYVTGKVFVWLDADEQSVTTGDAPDIRADKPTVVLSRHVGQTSNGTNETLTYSTDVKRSFSVTAKLATQNSTRTVSWSQTLSYSNQAHLSRFGFDQVNDFLIEGSDQAEDSGDDGRGPYRSDYRYPLFSNSTSSISDQGNMTLHAHLVQGLRLQVRGPSVFPTGLEAFGGGKDGKLLSCDSDSNNNDASAGSLLSTSKEGTASFFQTGDGKNSSGFGDSTQVFRFGLAGGDDDDNDIPTTELYFRNVSAVNGSVTHDQERVAGREVGSKNGRGQQGAASGPGLFAQAPAGGGFGPRAFTGRGGIAEAVVGESWTGRAGQSRKEARGWAGADGRQRRGVESGSKAVF